MTRREFLALLGVGASGAPCAMAADAAFVRERMARASGASAVPRRAASGTPAAVTQEKAVVVEVQSPRVIIEPRIHERRLGEMISQALQQLTETSTDADAWHAILEDDDVIGLKFNGSGAAGLAITEPFARLLVASLGQAGWAPEKIVLIEVGPRLVRQLKVQPRRTGWQSDKTTFGSGVDQLAAVLDQVTAIVNVPFFKANRIAGMSGCLKNLSHALVRHPAHYHANAKPDPKRGVLEPGSHCSPYIADIVACPAVRDKLRLHLVNALRTAREPKFNPTGSAVETYGAVLAGRDPVAVDMVGLEILNQQRISRNQLPLAKPDEPLPQLRAAAQVGLGIWDLDFIDHLTVRV